MVFSRETFTIYLSNFRPNGNKYKDVVTGILHEFSALSESSFKSSAFCVFNLKSSANRFCVFSIVKYFVRFVIKRVKT